MISAASSRIPGVQQGPIIAEFFGIFDTGWDQRLRSDTPLDKCNRVNIAFGKIIQDSTQHLTVAIDGSAERVKNLVGRVRQINPNAEIFLTTGGDGGPLSYGGASSDTQFAQNVLGVLQEFGFNGFDIDWENGLQKAQLSNLTTALHAALSPQGYKLTLDGWSMASEEYDMTVLKQTLDQINIMSYGASMDLGSCVNSYVTAGFPASKLIGGIETEIDYDGGVDTLGPEGSIAVKAQYALDNNLAGMMAWRLDNDYTKPDNPNFPTYLGGLQLWQSMTDPASRKPKPSAKESRFCQLF